MDLSKPQSKRPFVSVIIPFFNNREEVVQIEQSIKEQSYPSDHFEIIFVDNGSSPPVEFSKSFLERNILLREDKYQNSPYSARNRGIEAAKGEIIAFIDANSTPEKKWLENGVFCLSNSEYDLAGGNVQFDFQNRVTAGKIVDALTSLNMEKAIKERGVAYTANLFVKKRVVEGEGLFEEGVRSGGDVRWTLKAKQNGYKITYCESAIVRKYARSTKDLYRKKVRTGKGYFYTWKQEPEGQRRAWFYNFFRSLKPPTFSKIRKINPGRYDSRFDRKIGLVWFHFYVAGVVEQITFMLEFLKNRFR